MCAGGRALPRNPQAYRTGNTSVLVLPCREKSGARHPDWTGATGSCTRSQPPLQAVKHQPIHVHVSMQSYPKPKAILGRRIR